ncbi:MAG: pseudouridine synthase [Comamonadaceae bacterium]|nr:MAG: pseudouridine synthase [Comamonadaceae bacterium]
MLPVRDGVGPSQVALPPGPWVGMLDFLVDRFPAITADEWRARIARGEVVARDGEPVTPDQPYRPFDRLYYYRSVPDEAPNAAQAVVLFEDDLLVVADKPHYLPVAPSGNYLQETLLIRLRRQLGEPALTPVHRIDRETAGIVLFARQPATCAAYHALFARRAVTKSYQAIAPRSADLRFPLTRASTLVDGAHFMQMREGPDDGKAPNSHTTIDVIETRGAHARYRLQPLTGKRHQLRVHMAALGLPIVGDRIYPALLPHGTDAVDNPLRLLAERLAFHDPVTGEARDFASRQQLHFPDDATD